MLDRVEVSPATEEMRLKAANPRGYLERKMLSDSLGRVTEPPLQRPPMVDQSAPLTLKELEEARNRAVRLMIGRLREMKPQEVIQAVNVLDGEMAARKVNSPEESKKMMTRDEALKVLQGEAAPKSE